MGLPPLIYLWSTSSPRQPLSGYVQHPLGCQRFYQPIVGCTRIDPSLSLDERLPPRFEEIHPHRPVSQFHLSDTVALMNHHLLDSGIMAICNVSYLDTEGLRHKVEVQAESLYEAAVLALRAFREHDCEPVGMRELEVEIRSSITHTVTVQKVHQWLTGGAKHPKDAVMKDRLRALL